ncbi:MAG: fimbrial biogenesis outer membrane usher protein [Gammaproteobacteria bacterium]|nr:fimbrial biogenesis outer membrane usher protein [Gammaproteobacteria bacterium]
MEAVVNVTVNSQPQGETLIVLRDESGALWFDAADFPRLRLLAPPGSGHIHLGRRYLPLSAVPGVSFQLDEAAQAVVVTAPPAAFAATHVSKPRALAPVLGSASPGAFLNYQLSAQRVAGIDLTGAYAELGLFAAPGVLLNSGVLRTLDSHTESVRLDSSYTMDFPARIERLTFGDAISDGSTWGSAVRFGGIGWGRNFSLRPDLITAPLLSATGTALVPSTVDVYVNNQKVSSATLPPGPFVIDQLPAVTGAGQVSVVVRDALGREQQVTQPFYSSLQLLAGGLSQYEVDFGKVRRDYTTASDHYGPLMGSASYRLGVSNALTLEAHGEYLEGRARAAGVAGAAALGHVGVVNFTAAAGGGPGTSGALYGLGFERQGRRVNFALNTSIAGDGYRQISSAEVAALQFRRRDLVQVGLNLHGWGSLAAVVVRQEFTALPTVQTASLSYSRNLTDRGALNLTATRSSQGGMVARSIFLSFTLALAERRAAVFTANGGSGPGSPDDELYATYIENPPRGPGQGWRLGGSSRGNYDGELREQWQPGDLLLQGARNHGVSGASVFWSGAATLLGGELRAARQVTGSFALVDVAGLPDVPVYLDNQLVAYTNSQGRALLPDLLPYEANRVNVEPTELPLDTSIAARTLTVTPRYRSGVLVRFPVERVRGGTFRLVNPDGVPLPAGALVRFMGQEFPVTYEGVTYVTGFDHGTAGSAQWGGRRCSFRLEPPPMDDPLPDMGTVTCHPLPAAERKP